MTHNPEGTEYRPAIDGLRALAVLSVLVFHLSHQWLPGGFVGVDVFFVISGYLISTIILKDCERGSFSLAKFYQRRIARIFPAFFTVALATIIGSFFVYSPQDLASAGANLAAAVLSVANLKYMLQGNYFALSPDAQPFLHYWSLSVEEQFYMVFPVGMLLLYRHAPKNKIAILSLASIGSFIACVLLTRLRPVWAFYLLPTRAFELLAGCILAVYRRRERLLPSHPMIGSVPVLGLLLIGCSFLLVNEDNHFPGYLALVPVVGTVCILWQLKVHHPVERFLSLSPLVWIGRMSYSLYLWHWPIFSLTDYRMFLSSGGTRLVVKIGLSAVATVVSFFLIENPGRRYLNLRRNRRIAFAAVGVVLVLFVPIGIEIRKANYINADASRVAQGGVVFNPSSRKGSLVLMGDSMASMYGGMIKEVANNLGYRLNVISVADGDPLPRSTRNNGQLWADSLALVEREKPDILLLACAWLGKLVGDRGRLDIAVEQLTPHVGRLILLTQPPILPEKASRKSIRAGSGPPFYEDPLTKTARISANDYLKTLAHRHIVVIDVEPHFSAENGELIYQDSARHELYHGDSHLSWYGAELVKPDVVRAITLKDNLTQRSTEPNWQAPRNQ